MKRVLQYQSCFKLEFIASLHPAISLKVDKLSTILHILPIKSFFQTFCFYDFETVVSSTRPAAVNLVSRRLRTAAVTSRAVTEEEKIFS